MNQEQLSKVTELLGKEFVVSAGSISLIDVLPHPLSGISADERIVQAARVSYLGESKGDVADKKLIGYMMKNHHTSPFEQVEFVFRVKCPLFVARQWMRHRTYSFNEISRRFTAESIEFWRPESLPVQSEKNKQGRSNITVPAEKDYLDRWYNIEAQANQLYDEMVADGVAREIARCILPTSLMTMYYAKIDMNNLMKFLTLRCDNHAQLEIREFALVMRDQMMAVVAPYAYEYYMESLPHE